MRQSGQQIAIRYEALLASTRSLVEVAGRHHHSPLVVNNHPLQFAEDPDWLRMLIETARVEQLAVLDVDGYAAFVSALTDSVVALDEAGHRVLVQAAEQDLIVRNYAGESALVDGRPQRLRETQLFDLPVKTLTLTRGTHTISLP